MLPLKIYHIIAVLHFSYIKLISTGIENKLSVADVQHNAVYVQSDNVFVLHTSIL